ncbi:MAG: glycoside hydrolase family 2 protein, partial [Thermoleophilia bacterium]
MNYRMKAWLNGRPIGRNRGAYLPFELRLPRGLIRRGRVNRLVVRVDSRRFPTDFPPAGLSTTGVPTGGWWNYGGILREVYLQRIDTMQLQSALVNPRLPCATCDATVVMETRLRNVAGRARRATVTGTFGDRAVKLGTRMIRGGRTASFRGSFTLADPHLWSPRDPFLSPAAIEVRVGSRLVGRWTASSGVRSVKVSGGRLLLNDRAVSLRGVGVHEDNQAQGFAVDNTWRRWLVDRAKELGASMLRTHYPMHPYIHELADKLGLLIWSEIPVYAVKTKFLKRLEVRKLAARELEANILANQNHPSIMLWSIGNEMSSQPRPLQSDYIERAARQANALDPARPIALAVAG